MRITPMIVWASSLEETEFFKAIVSECEHTHPNRLVQDAIKVYSLAVKMLLNNPSHENKVIKAIEKCQELAMEYEYEDPESNESVFGWLSLANDLYEKIDRNDLTNFQSLKDKGLDCTENEGWI